jgi:eukaryotic-like serine/threonine-protein kinase
VHVLDWGIARVIEGAAHEDDVGPPSVDVSTADGDQTLVGTTLGTPGYMSIEQQRGQAGLDARADVYALGCILFEILTLRSFHPRGAPFSRVEPTPSIRAPDRDIPPELDAIVITATQIDRDERYATARALGDAVQGFLDGDRDLALRKQLAAKELAAALAAVELDDRPTAIHAAARALALDPANRASADLVARLMLEPPKTIPREVDDAVDRVDLDALYASRKLIACGGLVFFAFVPLMLWIGFRDPFVLGSAIVLAAVVGATGFVPRHRVLLATRIALVAIAVAVAIVARTLSPFLIAPGLAAVAGMVIATHPKVARPWMMIALFGAAVLGPWLLETVGVLSTTTRIVGTTIVLTASSTDHVDPTATLVTLSAYALLMVILAIAFGAILTSARRAAQRVVQVQTWQLGQLVPRAAD